MRFRTDRTHTTWKTCRAIWMLHVRSPANEITACYDEGIVIIGVDVILYTQYTLKTEACDRNRLFFVSSAVCIALYFYASYWTLEHTVCNYRGALQCLCGWNVGKSAQVGKWFLSMIQGEYFINIAGLLSGVSYVMLHVCDQFDDSFAFI